MTDASSVPAQGTGTGNGTGNAKGELCPTRADLQAAQVSVIKRGHGAKPDVVLVQRESGGSCIVKDYSGRSAFVRRRLAPFLLAREARVHEALRKHACVPRRLGRVDELAHAFEYCAGEPLSRALGARLGADRAAQFVRDLDAAVRRMHALGVVHLDLRHRDNILCSALGEPVLLDFAGAMKFRPGSFWYRWYRPTVLVYDESALRKWGARLMPGAEPRPRGLVRRMRRIRSALRRSRRPKS
jgi:serine/threonine protein kinase